MCTLSLSVVRAQVRVNNPKETVERGVEGRVNGRIDGGINRGLDKLEEGVGNIFKKKEKKPTTRPTSADDTYDSSAETNGEARTNPQRQESASAAGRGNGTSQNQPDEPRSLKAYSKFDFVPGEKVVAVEDFGPDAVGDYPARWNTNASGEVVTIDGLPGKWFQFADKGTFYPEFVKNLPDNATIEFDMVTTDDFSNSGAGLKVFILDTKDRSINFDQHFGASAQAGVDIHPSEGGQGSSSVWVNDKSRERILANDTPIAWRVNAVNRIAFWKQKSRLRVYINESKIWDIPRAFDPTTTYSLLFATYILNGRAYLSNLRVAVGAPDTRSKLIAEGKFSTTGILFDVNSDKIRPESYGVLKDIGTVLKENPGVRVKIVGHTDSDGDDVSNLALSKRRAAAVKTALTAEFGIEAARLDTDGKGESQPVGPNTTAEGKANNRRVEFLKL
ncbi:OmpA family protein [Rudanella paleaurantiibacter]|uniref:OmpA family protein n=1 Tax=Rudanella paleaurantiibacter TaxID=2614655 RepID=A0A7J5TTD1_9BACT|nr:OmpA family protein [Rudanella paleaurantiibacter]